MSHMYPVLIINYLNDRVRILLSYSIVKLLDNRHKYRNNLFKVSERPFLKCLSKDGMVGISTGLAYHINCIVHSEILFLSKNSDKLRNNHSRMCIVNLNYCILIKVMQIVSRILHILYDESCGITYHKVLLIDTKKMSCLV